MLTIALAKMKEGGGKKLTIRCEVSKSSSETVFAKAGNSGSAS